MDELKPCPFCGGEAITTVLYTFWGDYQCEVNCQNCRAKIDGERETTGKEALEDAIAKWNRRME